MRVVFLELGDFLEAVGFAHAGFQAWYILDTELALIFGVLRSGSASQRLEGLGVEMLPGVG